MFDAGCARAYASTMLTPPCRAILWASATAAEALAVALASIGCEVRSARDEPAAAELKATWRPEVVFLHQTAPGDCGRLRRTPPHLDLVYCALVEAGQLAQVEQPEYDDFLVLPLDLEETAARVRLWRWRRERLPGEGILRAGPLAVDLRHLRVTVEGAPVELTHKEYELLAVLLKRRGQVLTRESILDAVWGPEYYGGERTVDVHIRRLRMKLPEVADQIATVHGVGYRFER
jgi:DNA-binding response OmpR family regulator